MTSLNLECDEMKERKRDWRKENEKKWIDKGIGDVGAQTISETLKINTSLTSLNLECDENKMKWKRKKREEKKMKWNE